MSAGDGTANKADGLGSQLAVRLHGLTVYNRTAGSYGALSTTVQLKGFNLDVIPAPVRGLQGMRRPHTEHACPHTWKQQAGWPAAHGHLASTAVSVS